MNCDCLIVSRQMLTAKTISYILEEKLEEKYTTYIIASFQEAIDYLSNHDARYLFIVLYQDIDMHYLYTLKKLSENRRPNIPIFLIIDQLKSNFFYETEITDAANILIMPTSKNTVEESIQRFVKNEYSIVLESEFQQIEEVINNIIYKDIRSIKKDAQILKSLLYTIPDDLEEISAQLSIIAWKIMTKESHSINEQLIKIACKNLIHQVLLSTDMKEIYNYTLEYIVQMRQFILYPDKKTPIMIINQIKEYVEDNLDKNIQLSDVSNKFYYSYSYLSRLFKEEVKVNFSQYVIDRRIEKAKYYLLSTNKNIGEIALEVGYSNPNSFRRVFKQKENLSCTAFRKMARKKQEQH